jgi:uncharacterized protein (UPF0548 family)
MKLSFRFPSSDTLDNWRSLQKSTGFSYTELEGTLNKRFPDGYDHDINSCLLGIGTDVYQKAVAAIEQWQMFSKDWLATHPTRLSINKGGHVLILARVFGVWVWNCCRIVYTIDEAKRFGFGYGTLKNHVETGEELFFVEINSKNEVWYHLRAFSRPTHLWMRPFKPLLRLFQRKFIASSFASMQKAVQ